MINTFPPNSPSKIAYSVKELQRLLGVSHSSLYRAIGRGDLHTVKFGHRTLILRASLDAFIESFTAGSPKA